MGDHVAFKFEGCVSGVVGRCFIFLAVFVPARRNMPRADAGYAFHFAEQIVEHIAPVTDPYRG